MKIVDVIPFNRTLQKTHLSYFTARDINVGNIVSIDIRNKLTYGLVVEVRDVSKDKETLKKSQFSLRKIKGVLKNNLFNKQFIEASHIIADQFATSVGSVLQSLTPAKILDEIKSLENNTLTKNNLHKELNEKYIVQDNEEGRFSHYKNLIRESFAKKKSIFFICPTIEDTRYSKEKLQKGIEDHVIILNSAISKKEMLNGWNKAISHAHPVLIVMTPGFMGLPRHDIGSIILEKENSKSYRTQRRPYMDMRFCAETYAGILGAKLFLGDSMLRTDTLWRYDQGVFYESGSLKFRSLSSANQEIVDMKKPDDFGNNVFSIFSQRLKDIIVHGNRQNQNTFLFVARRGLAPSVVCSDCGTVVSCNDCKSPVVLHGRDATKKENYFKCHHCGDVRSAGEMCNLCGGWRLQTLGIGVETVEKEIAKLFPEITVFTLDADSAKTHKKARAIVKEFYDTPGSVLVGTEMAILYLHEELENCAVISIDSLFGLPDFHIRERLMNILLKIRSLAIQTFTIQTRRADDSIFEFAKQGNLAEFYRDEFIDRKKFLYPPFSILIKITLAGSRGVLEKTFEGLTEYLLPHELIVYPAFTERIQGKFVMHGVIKIPRKKWIDKDLLEKLRSLPPNFRVIVDAESLL